MRVLLPSYALGAGHPAGGVGGGERRGGGRTLDQAAHLAAPPCRPEGKKTAMARGGGSGEVAKAPPFAPARAKTGGLSLLDLN